MGRLLLVLAGCLQTLTFSPYNVWWLAPISIALVLMTCLKLDPRGLFRAGWFFGLGLFGSGASWIYVSISEYGNTSAFLAVLMTAAFAAFLALFPALMFWAWGKLAKTERWRRLVIFPGVWILGDWVRGWVLTGFPWLYLGTAQVDGPLAGWAPIGGVHGVSFLILATTTALYASLPWFAKRQWLVASGLGFAALLPWLLGPLALNSISWTTIGKEPLKVVAVQGNIPQMIKWDPEFLRHQIDSYIDLTGPYWDADLILWPETAIPIPHTQAGPVFERITARLGEQSALITGIPWFGYSTEIEDFTFHNSIMAMGNGNGIYHKQKLVPFGEYVPLQQLLRGMIGFFDLPMSSFTPGGSPQSPLVADGLRIMPFICYEIAYPQFVAFNAHNTDLLLTISNDGWFGNSIGPLQHMEIARMRALETGRYMVRGTNNGLTAIIDNHGQIDTSIPRFEPGVLRGEVYPATGATPFMQAGSWPVITLSIILVVFFRARIIPKPKQQQLVPRA